MPRSAKNSAAKLAAIPALLCLAACAQVVAPPGGPEDKESPTLLASTPHSNQTAVGPIRELEVVFSEALNSRSAERAVFVTPRQDPPAEIKVKGERLLVRFPDTLATGQTYIVTVSAELTDLRGNKLGQSRTIAFTRGDLIDTNFVAGVVTNNNEPASGATVALYRSYTPGQLGDLDSLYPTYLTQSGSKGEFEFSFLPPGDFFLLAFQDRDKNQRFSYGVERFGLPTESLQVGRRVQENLELRLQTVDTASVALRGVTTTVDGLVRLSLIGSVDPAGLAERPELVRRVSPDDSLTRYPARGLRDPSGAPRSKFELFIPAPAGKEYRLEALFAELYSDGRQTKNSTLQSYRREAISDTLGPQLVVEETQRRRAPWEPVVWDLRFSEPLDSLPIAPEDFAVRYLDGAPVRFSLERVSPFHLRATLRETPLPGAGYELSAAGALFRDLAGNPAPDSLIERRRAVWEADSLGTLTLNIANLFDSAFAGEYLLRFVRLEGGEYETRSSVQGDSLRLELPAGGYIIEVVADSETELTPGSRDDGALYPLRWAERRSFYPDTVRVRPRFEIGGITVTLE